MDSENALNRYFSVLEGRKKARYLSCRKLRVKADTANDIMKSCHFCERRCSVNRLRGEKGYCGVLESRVASEFIHMGEEPELVPSYTIGEAWLWGLSGSIRVCPGFRVDLGGHLLPIKAPREAPTPSANTSQMQGNLLGTKD